MDSEVDDARAGLSVEHRRGDFHNVYAGLVHKARRPPSPTSALDARLGQRRRDALAQQRFDIGHTRTLPPTPVVDIVIELE
jgi:hypothetical protein